MALILTMFGRNRSRSPNLKFEKKFRAVVAVVVGFVVVDHRRRRLRRLLPRLKTAENFKRPKNGEDGSDFDDFWTKRIAALSAKFCKIFALSKKFSRGRKLQKTFAKSSKKFVLRAISGKK